MTSNSKAICSYLGLTCARTRILRSEKKKEIRLADAAVVRANSAHGFVNRSSDPNSMGDPACYKAKIGDLTYQYRDSPCSAVNCQWPKDLKPRPHFYFTDIPSNSWLH